LIQASFDIDSTGFFQSISLSESTARIKGKARHLHRKNIRSSLKKDTV